MGITEIISPEQEIGLSVARRLMNPSLVSYLDLPDDYSVVEIIAPKHTRNLEYGQIDFRDKYKLSLITIRRNVEEWNGQNNQHVLGVVPRNVGILIRKKHRNVGNSADMQVPVIISVKA